MPESGTKFSRKYAQSTTVVSLHRRESGEQAVEISCAFTKLSHFRGRPRPELLYAAGLWECPTVAFGMPMTKPANYQDTSNTNLDRSSSEFDNPSDCCDFGYDLVVSGVQLKSNGVGEANPKPQSDRDPADHRGKA